MNKKFYGIVYKATNIVNGKYYIGMTKGTLNGRKKGHLLSARKGAISPFYCAIRKYGEDNFKWEILLTVNTKKELELLEIETIAKYNACDLNYGYNILKGGMGGCLSGERHPLYGTSRPDVTERNIKNNPSKSVEARYLIGLSTKQSLGGKTYEEIYGDRADEEREKRLQALSKSFGHAKGKKQAPEHIKKRMQKQCKNWHVYNSNTDEYLYVNNLKVFSKENGLYMNCMYDVANKRLKQYRGFYIWYETDEKFQEELAQLRRG